MIEWGVLDGEIELLLTIAIRIEYEYEYVWVSSSSYAYGIIVGKEAEYLQRYLGQQKSHKLPGGKKWTVEKTGQSTFLPSKLDFYLVKLRATLNL